MGYLLQAVCGCHMGNIRRNNEDNFYFDGNCLDENNRGLPEPLFMEVPVKKGLCLAVFDGMGGENFGETAAFAAAKAMKAAQRSCFHGWMTEGRYLRKMVQQLNTAVVERKTEMKTSRMGTTMAALYFTSRHIYSCNIGDSRAYRLREGVLEQLSRDHVETRAVRPGKKAPLTQHLGIDLEDMLIEPYIVKDGLMPGDQYLICSDGLTDMLTNLEITDIMRQGQDPVECVKHLLEKALEHGGRDNITVILGKIL